MKIGRNDLEEFRCMETPPKDVENVFAAVMILIKKQTEWQKIRMELGSSKFLKRVRNLDLDNVSVQVHRRVLEYVKRDDFNAEALAKKSALAGQLCAWVIAVVNYVNVLKATRKMYKAAELLDQQRKVNEEIQLMQ